MAIVALGLSGAGAGGAIALAAGIGMRPARCGSPGARCRVPLVAVLHIACAWIPLHLLLRALVDLGAVAPSVATHALTAGADRPADAGDDDAHRTRPHRPAAEGRPHRRRDLPACTAGGAAARRSRRCWRRNRCWPRCRPRPWPGRCAFGLYAVHYGPWLMRPAPTASRAEAISLSLGPCGHFLEPVQGRFRPKTRICPSFKPLLEEVA